MEVGNQLILEVKYRDYFVRLIPAAHGKNGLFFETHHIHRVFTQTAERQQRLAEPNQLLVEGEQRLMRPFLL